MTNTSLIKRLLAKHFHDPWTERPLEADEYEIMPDHTVNVHVSITVNPNIRLPRGRFPLQFGTVTGYFSCSVSELKSLVGAPTKVVESFNCRHNQLTSLVGAPLEVGGDFSFDHNPLTNLEGFPNLVSGTAWLPYDSDMPLLRTLTAKQLKFVDLPINLSELRQIMNKHAGTGRRGAFSAAKEINSAGEVIQRIQELEHNPFERNARW